MVYNKSEVMDFVKRALGKNADGVYLSQRELNDGWEDSLYSDEDCSYAVNEWGADYESSRGISRFVIIPNDKNYVIKLPITGIYEEVFSNEDENENEDEEEEYKTRVIAKANEECDDPSADEISIYKFASKLEKQILLQTIYVGDYNGIPVYVQQKITETLGHSDHDNDDISEDSRKIIRDTIRKATNGEWCSTPCPEMFVLDIINFYGIKKAQAMLKFLYTLDDLHSNNVGYIANRPVVVDYGGFAGSSYLWIWD